MRIQRSSNTWLAATVAAGLLLISAVAIAQGAIVQKDYFTGGPVFTPLGFGTITNSNYVQTPSGNWSITVQGTLNDLDNAPDRAERWTDETLATFCLVPGDTFTLVVTPTGQINLSCRGN